MKDTKNAVIFWNRNYSLNIFEKELRKYEKIYTSIQTTNYIHVKYLHDGYQRQHELFEGKEFINLSKLFSLSFSLVVSYKKSSKVKTKYIYNFTSRRYEDVFTTLQYNYRACRIVGPSRGNFLVVRNLKVCKLGKTVSEWLIANCENMQWHNWWYAHGIPSYSIA